MGDVIREPLPPAIHGPRPRRRPPKEQWILNQDVHQQEPVQQQATQEEVEERHLTGSGRLTRPPDFFGREKGRDEMEPDQMLNTSTSSVDRVYTPLDSTLATSCSPTPPGTAEVTPISTPATSPDTSAVAFPQDLSWLLDPMPCSQGRTVAERANDVLERHRHWSFIGPGVAPNHPRFLKWHDGGRELRPRRRRSSAEQ